MDELEGRSVTEGENCLEIAEAAFEARFQARRLSGISEAVRSLGFTLTKIELAAG